MVIHQVIHGDPYGDPSGDPSEFSINMIHNLVKDHSVVGIHGDRCAVSLTQYWLHGFGSLRNLEIAIFIEIDVSTRVKCQTESWDPNYLQGNYKRRRKFNMSPISAVSD